MDRGDPRAGGTPPANQRAAAHPPARIRGFMGLRVRGGDHRRPGVGGAERDRPGPDGIAWWHASSLGHFFNSLHFWSAQMFFIFMVLHLWGQYWMASWRDGRAKTWMVGVVIFLVSVVTAFTGYLIQQNFELPVDRGERQGCGQRDRVGRLLQRPQLWRDVWPSRHALPHRRDLSWWCSTSSR